MTAETVEEAFWLLRAFLRQDVHYIDSSAAYGDGGDDALRSSLERFLSSPELGFVWLAFQGGRAIAVCVVSFAISTSAGAVVAKMDDVYVASEHRGRGIGAAHFAQLCQELKRLGVVRVDTSVHRENEPARRFYERLGFRALHEDRIAYLIGGASGS
jgi:GNAT superfamily N-acetyltransferase